MKKFKLIPLFLLLAMLFVLLTVAKAAPNKSSVAAVTSTQSYSTWLWNTYEIIDNSDSLLNFLVANNVTDVHLQKRNDGIDYSYYQNFISKAAANNISVHALEGSPEWVMPDGDILQNAFNVGLRTTKPTQLRKRASRACILMWSLTITVPATGPPERRIGQRIQDFPTNAKTQAANLQLNLAIDIPFWFHEVQFKHKSMETEIWPNGSLQTSRPSPSWPTVISLPEPMASAVPPKLR